MLSNTEKSSTTVAVGLLSLLFFFGIFLRFYRLTEIGVDNSDDFFYWQTGLEWSRGNEVLTEHFRPLIYWIHGILMNIIGVQDWTLKIFNVTCDLLTSIVLIVLGLRMRKSVLLGLAAAVSYLFLFQVLKAARADIVSPPSTLFVVLSFWSLIEWLIRKKTSLLFLSSFFLSMAWHTHPDLAVLGAALFFAIFWKKLSVPDENFWVSGFKDILVLLAGYFLIFVLFSFKFDVFEILSNFLANHKTQTKKLSDTFIIRLAYYSYWYLRFCIGTPAIFLLIVSVGLFFYRFWKKAYTSVDATLPLFPFIFLFFCALLFAQTPIPRLLLPLTPLIVLFVHVMFFDATVKWKVSVSLLVTLFFVAAHFRSIRYPFIQKQSPYISIEEDLNPFLKNDSRFLITPISTYHIHSPLSKEVYLGGKGLYISSTDEGSLDEVFQKNKITHVWIADVLYDKRVFGHNIRKKYIERLRTLLGMDHKDYVPTAEKERMRELLKGRSILVNKSEFGELYELK